MTLFLRGFHYHQILSDFKKNDIKKYLDKATCKVDISNTNMNQVILDNEKVCDRRDPSKSLYFIGQAGGLAESCIHCGEKIKTETATGVAIKVESFSDKLIFYHLGKNLCSFSCRLKHIRDYRSDPIYKDAEQLTFREFNLLYPGETLMEAPDRRNYIRFGGFLTNKSVGQFYFRPTANVSYRDVKRESCNWL